MKRRNERQKGFTLIELLVVLIVIAVLAAVLVPALTSYLDDAREKKAVSEAQVCVTAATEWAAVQRTALISQAYQTNKSFADAYNAAGNTAKWSNDYAALNTAAPTVTGTPALAEGDGQYFLRPDSTPDDTTTGEMKNTVKAAAGVNGKLEKLQLNADGKVLYLRYTSAEGITVAYTAAGTAQTPDTTIPVANLPENKTPTPSEPDDHSGDLVFCVKDEYTGKPVPGIMFRVVDDMGNTVFGSQTTDDKGMVYFDLDVSSWNPNSSNCKYFTLHPESWPEGYQQVFDVRFSISAEKKDGSQTYNSYRINGIEDDKNENTAKYKKGEPGTLPGGAKDHLYTFYARTVPTLQLRVLDYVNNRLLKDVKFTLSKEGTSQSIDITSSLNPTLLYVQLHEKDHLPSGCEFIDLRSNDSTGDWLVNFTDVPEGYQYFDNCRITIRLQDGNGHNSQLYTEFQSGQQFGGKQSNTVITCDNQFDNNKYIVTIRVQGGKDVNFLVYDGLDSVHKSQLPNAKLQLCRKDNTVLATFTTDKYGKPKDTENFTETLPVGDYFLHLESGTPTGYTPPTDIPFKVERGADGLLTLTGDAAYVDNENSTVTMLVTKPNTKRIQLQVVDAFTGKPWAGVNVKVTGECLKADMTKEERYYAIDSLANNMHTIDLDSVNGGKIMVTIVGSDNKDSEFKDNYHSISYTNNFVGSKYEFKLQKNTDGTVTLTPNSGNYSKNGEIDGSIVKVYAYPQVIVDFDTKGVYAGVDLAGRKSILHIVTSEGAIPTTVNGEKLSNWLVKIENRNHSVGLSLGSYKLYEERETLGYYKTLNLPLQFKVTRQTNGFPAVTDWDGNQILDYVTQKPYKDENGNNLPKITAWYQSASYVGP